MNELQTYINSLSPSDQAEYAARCGTTIGYLRKAISKKSKFDGKLCRLLDQESGGAVKKARLRPDIWPELLTEAAS